MSNRYKGVDLPFYDRDIVEEVNPLSKHGLPEKFWGLRQTAIKSLEDNPHRRSDIMLCRHTLVAMAAANGLCPVPGNVYERAGGDDDPEAWWRVTYSYIAARIAWLEIRNALTEEKEAAIERGESISEIECKLFFLGWHNSQSNNGLGSFRSRGWPLEAHAHLFEKGLVGPVTYSSYTISRFFRDGIFQFMDDSKKASEYQRGLMEVVLESPGGDEIDFVLQIADKALELGADPQMIRSHLLSWGFLVAEHNMGKMYVDIKYRILNSVYPNISSTIRPIIIEEDKRK